jgi:hypothetical protein
VCFFLLYSHSEQLLFTCQLRYPTYLGITSKVYKPRYSAIYHEHFVPIIIGTLRHRDYTNALVLALRLYKHILRTYITPSLYGAFAWFQKSGLPGYGLVSKSTQEHVMSAYPSPCSKGHLIDPKTNINLLFVSGQSTTLHYINTFSLSSPMFSQIHRESSMIPKPSITSTMTFFTMIRKRRACLNFVRKEMDMNTMSTTPTATVFYYPDLCSNLENKRVRAPWFASRKEAKAQSPCLFRWLPTEDLTERTHTSV